MENFDAGKSNDEGLTVKPPYTAQSGSAEIYLQCISQLYPEFLQMITSELVNAVEGAGLTLDAQDDTQLLEAIPILAAAASPVKAWLKYDGEADSIFASNNIASVTKNATGDYSVTLTTALTDDDYVVNITCSYEPDSGSNHHIPYIVAQTDAGFDFEIWGVDSAGNRGALVDSDVIGISVFR